MNAIVTICFGPTHQTYFNISRPTIEQYAQKIGADLIVIDQIKLATASPHFEKFQIHELLEKYERIIYLDTDLIIREDCPNLFDIVPEEKIGAFDESPFKNNKLHLLEASKTYNIEIQKDYDGSYYNTGVMVISRMHRDMFELPSTQSIYNHYDQSYLNLFIQANHVKMHKLHHKYNRMVLMDNATGEHRLNSYIIHYAGIQNQAHVIMERDLQRWSQGQINLPKQAVLACGARLGDIISAEPVIRHMVEKEYKDYQITILCNQPRAYKHLEQQAAIMHFEQFQRNPDLAYVTQNVMLPQTHPIWKFMTASCMHTVDWMSINCLRHTLPDEQKTIKLSVTTEGYAETLEVLGNTSIDKIVIVHPGRSWPSKTFPAHYWETIINKLLEDGHNVGIIGRDIGDELEAKQNLGIVKDLKIPEEAIDLTNLLSLDGLIALLSKAPILISNDSAPIHIAGAFDNHIMLIPTCKHPDFILPWRHNSKYYKSRAFYKKPMWEQPCKNPLSLYGYNLSKVPEDSGIEDYLPDVEEIIDYVESLSREVQTKRDEQ